MLRATAVTLQAKCSGEHQNEILAIREMNESFHRRTLDESELQDSILSEYQDHRGIWLGL